jgi:glycosyltransferase involved in cell wall biosynthesis
MTRRVLADFHHHDLYEALSIVFVDRFGWELYRPTGMEWFDREYWNFERTWHGDKVAHQYLDPWGGDRDCGDWWERDDKSHPGRVHRMVTLDQARSLKPDFVIATVDHNHEGLWRFARENGAHFGIQLGNVDLEMNATRWDLAEFALVSTRLLRKPWIPFVLHHQEFDMNAVRYEPPIRNDPFRVSSFVNCFAENVPMYALFRDTAKAMPEFDWRVYGAYGSVEPDEYAAGNIGVCADVAAAMRASDVIWHAKKWSDGFGHVIHSAFAVGRPVFAYEDYYREQMAGDLFAEGVTSFDLARRSRDEVRDLLRRLREDEEFHVRVSEAAAARFREVVNFDAEAAAIYAMLAAIAA